MEMVWHDNKLVQQIFFFRAIVTEDVEKEASHSVGLKDVALLKCRGSDEVATVSGITAAWSGHGGTSAAEAAHPCCHSIAAVKPLRHPKPKNVSLSQFETSADDLYRPPLELGEGRGICFAANLSSSGIRS
jgi:hypothetical protein